MGNKKKRASRNGTQGASITPEPNKHAGPKTVLKEVQADGVQTEKESSELDTSILSKFLQADSAGKYHSASTLSFTVHHLWTFDLCKGVGSIWQFDWTPSTLSTSVGLLFSCGRDFD
jgi:hypothetical protein